MWRRMRRENAGRGSTASCPRRRADAIGRAGTEKRGGSETERREIAAFVARGERTTDDWTVVAIARARRHPKSTEAERKVASLITPMIQEQVYDTLF